MSESDAKRAVRIARAVLDGKTSAFLGCKQLLGPLQRLGVDRRLWNEQALAREDGKLAEWLPQIEPAIREACRAVVRRFGEGG